MYTLEGPKGLSFYNFLNKSLAMSDFLIKFPTFLKVIMQKRNNLNEFIFGNGKIIII